MSRVQAQFWPGMFCVAKIALYHQYFEWRNGPLPIKIGNTVTMNYWCSISVVLLKGDLNENKRKHNKTVKRGGDQNGVLAALYLFFRVNYHDKFGSYSHTYIFVLSKYFVRFLRKL